MAVAAADGILTATLLPEPRTWAAVACAMQRGAPALFLVQRHLAEGGKGLTKDVRFLWVSGGIART
eukprot:CAMPEP_0115048200 /NCGR_PEP_ID=MMETSP0227-20121206/419_1 /TAXON_ID=89957 /ORGANISM="Polarella glacialis, Strain CCMP 1383" /LENGTH=65 /DNA_ID=CAMNT_0002431563 /DNA_START=103 /DNA_END=297 /DNA_ORIENTATION=+